MKIYLIFSIIILLSLSFNVCAEIDNPVNARNFPELLAWVIRVIFWLSVIALPISIIAGGFLYLTSASNPSNIELAKKIILYSVVIFGTVLMIKLLVTYFAGELTFTT
jgi:hypothetical protein